MKISLSKLSELKDFIKLSWLARQAGWDRSTLHVYVNDDSKNLGATPNAVRRMKRLLKALKEIRRAVNRSIRYLEKKIRNATVPPPYR